jgi:hypothetical protein
MFTRRISETLTSGITILLDTRTFRTGFEHCSFVLNTVLCATGTFVTTYAGGFIGGDTGTFIGAEILSQSHKMPSNISLAIGSRVT